MKPPPKPERTWEQQRMAERAAIERVQELGELFDRAVGRCTSGSDEVKDAANLQRQAISLALAEYRRGLERAARYVSDA